jgi:hypothetical protein
MLSSQQMINACAVAIAFRVFFRRLSVFYVRGAWGRLGKALTIPVFL